MSSLLGSFRREKAKGRKSLGTGKGGTKEIYKSDWFAYTHFSFLMNKDDPRVTISMEEINDETSNSTETMLSSQVVEFEPTAGCSYNIETSFSTTELTDNITQTMKAEPKKFVKPSTPRKKRSKITKDKKEDPRIQKAFELLQQSMPREDPTYIFGQYLAEKLNQFDATTKAILIHKINQLIFDAEMEKCRMETVSPGLPSPSLSPSTSVSLHQLPTSM